MNCACESYKHLSSISVFYTLFLLLSTLSFSEVYEQRAQYGGVGTGARRRESVLSTVLETFAELLEVSDVFSVVFVRLLGDLQLRIEQRYL